MTLVNVKHKPLPHHGGLVEYTELPFGWRAKHSGLLAHVTRDKRALFVRLGAYKRSLRVISFRACRAVAFPFNHVAVSPLVTRFEYIRSVLLSLVLRTCPLYNIYTLVACSVGLRPRECLSLFSCPVSSKGFGLAHCQHALLSRVPTSKSPIHAAADSASGLAARTYY